MLLTRKIIFLLLSYFTITFWIYISPKTHFKHSTTQDIAKGKSQLKSGPDCSFQMSRKTQHGLCSTNIVFCFSSFGFWRQILTVTQAGHSNSWEFSCLSLGEAEITGMYTTLVKCFNSMSAASRRCKSPISVRSLRHREGRRQRGAGQPQTTAHVSSAEMKDS